MSLVAGATQAVETEDLLESLRARKGAGHSANGSVFGTASPGIPRTHSQARDITTGVAFEEPHAVVVDGSFYRIAKRTLDIIGALGGLLILSPLIAVVAIVTKLSDGGP